MASLTTEQLQELCDNTQQEIKNLKKPLSAYQYYTKSMRENWKSLTDEERDTFMLQAKHDHARYEKEQAKILDKSKEEIKKLKLYLSYSGDRVPCVGLDNGFTNYTIVGPMDTVEVFTAAEKQELISKGVPEKCIGKYKSVGASKFNWRAARKWGVTVYGGSQNGRSGWGGLRENYEGKAGKFTTYTNYKGETWTENY